MTILTTTYNCEKYVGKSLQSILNQDFKEFTCYITDDMSTDNTVEVVKRIIDGDDRFVLIENKKKMYQAGNYDQVTRTLPDTEFCIEIDGDDWLPNSGVLSAINEIYEDPNVWMTSGSFMYHDGRPGFANPPNNFINIRNQLFTLSHLRTWRAWLWNKIEPSDLLDESTGNYWDAAGDLAFMYPMVEMSGGEHYRFLNTINYIYNESNPLNEHKVVMGKVNKNVTILRNKPPYSKL